MGFSIFFHTCYLGLFPKYPDCILLCITKEHDWVFVWRGELPVKFYGGVTGLLILVHFFGGSNVAYCIAISNSLPYLLG
jgi:hypothetical protein